MKKCTDCTDGSQNDRGRWQLKTLAKAIIYRRRGLSSYLIFTVLLIILTSCSHKTEGTISTATFLNTEPPISNFQGLGSSSEEWNQYHQKGISSGGITSYDDDHFALTTYNDKINHLEIVWGDDKALSFDEAKAVASKYIPSDSQLEETYIPREYRVVERYTSSSLAPNFDDLAWLGSPPGEFIIIYRNYDQKVSSVVIALGNNP
jgi:hypothetical protein